MHGQFATDFEEKDKDNTWKWMRKIDVVPKSSLYELTISSTILIKLVKTS